MLYLRCPTCKIILGNKQLHFEQEVDRISKSSLNEQQQNEQKMELLDKLELKRYCCRTLILTYNRLIDIVI